MSDCYFESWMQSQDGRERPELKTALHGRGPGDIYTPQFEPVAQLTHGVPADDGPLAKIRPDRGGGTLSGPLGDFFLDAGKEEACV
jgi:hypothetical protein